MALCAGKHNIQKRKCIYTHIIRFIGPYRNYRYGGKGNNFYNETLSTCGVDTSRRCRGQVSFWNYYKSYGEITDDLTGEIYFFHHNDILGQKGFRELLLWRNVEFTPCKNGNFELLAENIIDLGPSSYMPPTGITEAINYPTNHLENKNQWDSIPSWYHPVRKSHAPLCQMPRVKPLIYQDAKWTGKY
eukprot:423517_1